MQLDFWNYTYYGNTILQYTITLGIILGSIILAKLFYWISKNILLKITSKTKTNLDYILVEKLEGPVLIAIIQMGLWYGLSLLNYPISELSAADIEAGITVPYSHTRAFIDNTLNFIMVLNITWFLSRIFDALIEEYIVPLAEKSETDLDDQLLPIFRKGLRVIIWVLGVLVGLNNAGFDVGAVLAGLGIGGLAFALAAQDTVKNFFGGLMIFADKPFRVGDRIKAGGFEGFVQEIGIRSTRVKTLEGRIVTIPNSRFSDDAVENVDLEPSRRIVVNLGLTYSTTPEKMELALETLNEISIENKHNIEDNPMISFTTFGDFSLGILYVYFIRKGSDILRTQSDINLSILKKFNEKGLEMAFPTQTVYHQAIKG